MKWLAIAMAIGSLMACGGGSGQQSDRSDSAAREHRGPIHRDHHAASTTCSANLPAATRCSHFLATVTQTGAAVQVELIAHAPGAPSGTVSGTVSGQTVNFSSFSLSQKLMGRGAALAASGKANVAADGSITGTLSGTYQTASGSSCNAANHQLAAGQAMLAADRERLACT